MKQILDIINKYKKNNANIILLENICRGGGLFFSIYFFNVIIEIFYYLDPFIKTKLVNFYFASFFIYVIYISMQWIITINSFFNYKNNFDVAREIGEKNKDIRDGLLNVLQINAQADKANDDLKKYATNKLKIKLKTYLRSSTEFIYPKKELSLLSFLIVTFLVCMINTNFNGASYRLLNFHQKFSLPLPFTLTSLSGNFTALSGDTLDINISGLGEIPDSINIKYVLDDTIRIHTVSHEKQIYNHQIFNIKEDITYWGEYNSNSFFSPWRIINTKKNIVKVKQRPIIKEVTFNISPPSYTNLDSYVHDQTNINQIDILEGSNININALSTKNLNSAWILNKNNRITMNVSNNILNQKIDFFENMLFSIYCLDNELVSNINPIQYSLFLKKDNSPTIGILSPQYEFELDESLLIPIKANIYDDYGIDSIWIEYKIVSPDFPNKQDNINNLNLMKIEGSEKHIYIEYEWDVNKLNILMGDEIHFWIYTSDKNNIFGPGIENSAEYIGKFPSLEDLFTRIEDYEDDVIDIVEDIENSLNEIDEMTEEIILESLKTNDLSWEQEKKLEKTFDEAQDIVEQIKNIQENIDKIMEQADNNSLFDNDLMEKFEKFREMLNNIMTEEIMDAIEKLQEAFNNMDQNKLMEALQNYEFNIEQFEEDLDRFMDMFEMAVAEQKLNELSEHIENMINKQEELIEDIENFEDNYILEKKSQKQENRFSDFDSLLDEAKKNIESLSKETSDKIESLQNSNLKRETKDLFSQQTQDIINKNDNSNNHHSAQSNLNEISEKLNELSQGFKNESILKMTKEFIIIIDNLITISNQQELLNQETQGIRSNSPELKKLNQIQNNIDRELNQITKQLIVLSSQTFFIDPKINRLIGKLKNSISKTINHIEQKKISKAQNNQQENLKYINEITFLLLISMEEMQNSNSASGFEKFIESLQQMTQEQQGINQGTMQLGQMGMMQQKSLLEQLMQQQQQLKDQLSEMLKNNPGEDTGGLSKALEDMEDIIQDFKNNNVNQATMERQQRILSRMLDSQKSLTKKDFDKKRQSKIAEDLRYLGPDNILDNKVDKDMLLINAMEHAVNEGLSLEYQKLIRLYFLDLQKENYEIE